ncbi:hypothetical protein [Flagellimonas flava]|uniref:Uncharacterized protein n=1 Tax=Flagellimonas flava TaxID=570519 RepID=A0A1M5KL55_9FLAO|nr:hypothetical protein [Allomuricauda flava]SHG53544.1 hypothetical protein SAMN04488116_1651 [Allomuricauda flava]
MRILTYLSGTLAATFLIGCSGGPSKKDIAQSPFYWTPQEIDTTDLLSHEFFSDIHKNNLGGYVFANETIERKWDDESNFVATYDMSKMEELALFCRLFIANNSGPLEMYKQFAVNPRRIKNAHLRYDYYLDSIHGSMYYDHKTTEEELGWESVRYPIFEQKIFEEKENEDPRISVQQMHIVEALLKHQKYVESKKDNSILLGLKYSVADGGTKGRWEQKKKVELAAGQVLLTNVDEGLELISKIPEFSVPEPFEPNKKLEEEALQLLQNYGRNHGWKEKFKKAIKTSDYNIKRNRFSGIIEGRTIIFAVVAEWPDGSWTYQYFNTYQVHQGNNEFGGLSYNGSADQHLIWGGAVDF